MHSSRMTTLGMILHSYIAPNKLIFGRSNSQLIIKNCCPEKQWKLFCTPKLYNILFQKSYDTYKNFLTWRADVIISILLIEEVRSQIQLVLEENLDLSYLKTSLLFIISDFLSHGKKILKYFKTLTYTVISSSEKFISHFKNILYLSYGKFWFETLPYVPQRALLGEFQQDSKWDLRKASLAVVESS